VWQGFKHKLAQHNTVVEKYEKLAELFQFYITIARN
tara:strand:- start:5440 stop:5547 length:108 start_codon:yes stop_codon:yes gene_type:complete